MGFKLSSVPYGRNYAVKFDESRKASGKYCEEAARLLGYKSGEYGGSYGLLCRIDERTFADTFRSA